MTRGSNLRKLMLSTLSILTAAIVACGGGGGQSTPPSATPSDEAVAITSSGPNVVETWNKLGAATITQPAATGGTPEERMPAFDLDLATLNVAIYDTLALLTGAYRPFMVDLAPDLERASLSQEDAVHGAAYTVLSGLFPARASTYGATYAAAVSAADSNGKQAIDFGAQVARKVIEARANDGRWSIVAPYIAGTEPGQFRGTNPINLSRPSVRPFSLNSASQFRASGPPALSSPEYAQDLNETKSMGSTTSTVRTDAQTENARFHTEAPPLFWTRNLQQFATSRPTLVENARLMAMIWVAIADASTACFESKYHFNFWRPTSAIRLADADGNDATEFDAQWTPIVPTPNHPEYPAAHACVAGALGGSLSAVFGTHKLQFALDSSVTGSTHTFKSIEEMNENVQLGRIHGGMHFRTSTVDGRMLGERVAAQLASQRFGSAAN